MFACRICDLSRRRTSVTCKYWPWLLSIGSKPLSTMSKPFEGNKVAHTLFNYTSGRWLYNEPLRLAERHLPFDVTGLKKVAAHAVDKDESDIKTLFKLAEGGFNRVFEIVFKDDISILARLPYSSTEPRNLSVASEVATLDFVRSYEIPVPRVLGYSATAENTVGAEYVLMEKLPGRVIGDRWFDLSDTERLKILYKIVETEAKLFSIELPASGSIYYNCDLPESVSKVNLPGSSDLVVGPFSGQRWWAVERADLDIDRGPHEKSLRVLECAAEKELAWIQNYGKPRFPFERGYRETFNYNKIDPNEHVKSLEEYLALAPYLVPPSTRLNRAILRHPDLQPNNILISEDFNITGLIDWQHTVILPVFLTVGLPKSFQNYGDAESESFVPPQLPNNLDTLDEDDRLAEVESYRRRHTHFFYLGFTQKLNDLHWHGIEQDASLLRRRIFEDAGSPWEGLNLPLQADVVRVLDNWPSVAQVNADGQVPRCPVSLDVEESKKRLGLEDSLHEVDVDLERIRGMLNISSDGWTSNELYESTKENAKLVKEAGLSSADDDLELREMSERHWPFDDFDEDE